MKQSEHLASFWRIPQLPEPFPFMRSVVLADIFAIPPVEHVDFSNHRSSYT